ncbi:glycosyltransferase [Actinokineospora iranica]|uniref:Glycosyl transferases group 1 n=1 Tax=Actinokineospora iranica TaxID=1271860 RepID=A0A1G6WPC7_9PSEU|nr:glycosyltransferase [Actinokineospora iranica]SDD67523.1 Glycosyl transferases group 1 [Actinokineospora iranica]
MKILLWHVHGGWTTSFVQGEHEYLLPLLPEGGPWGGGRMGRDWPAAAREVPVDRLADEHVDVVVLQRTEEPELVRRWLGKTPGEDVAAVFVEHNTPKGDVPRTRHPFADRPDLLIAHVTHFNELMWDTGTTPTTVVEHGIVDPGHRYTGELARAAVSVNEPVRRWRVTGTDLFPRFADAVPLDVFGMGCDSLGDAVGLGPDRLRVVGDLPTDRLHAEMARRRVYLHTVRWTSLGLSLLEAMHLGIPVVALGVTEAARAVPPEAGVLSTRVDDLVDALRAVAADPARAAEMGARAREFALARFGLRRFLRRWDDVLAVVASGDAAVTSGNALARSGNGVSA